MNQYYQVNWINGMKVNSGHFIDLENHFISRVQSAFRGVINDLSYGWIPEEGKQSTSPYFMVLLNQNKIKVLRGFIALTPGGNLIQIPPNLEFFLLKPEVEAKQYFLTISIKPFARVPFGKINDLESPLRVPNTLAEYQFDFLPQNNSHLHSLGNDIIPVGKYSGADFAEETEYIPPCSSIQSNAILIDLCRDLQVSFSNLESTVLELLKRSYSKESGILSNLVSFFNQNKTAIDWYLPYLPPVFSMEKIQQIARIIFYSNESQFKDEPRKLLNRIIEYKYNHLEINKAVDIARNFIKNSSDLLPDAFSIGV
jgi:hypothetical protein